MSTPKLTPFFEPLRAMDRQFLAMEDANIHKHVSGFSVYELEPLRSELGGVEFGAFRDAIAAALDRIPRYRQRLHSTPIEKIPVWVDAAEFDLDDHLYHLSLPLPGNAAQLKETVGWIVSQPLDASRPLWEMWLVEGVGGGKYFAVVTKMHHCMVDGGSGGHRAGTVCERAATGGGVRRAARERAARFADTDQPRAARAAPAGRLLRVAAR